MMPCGCGFQSTRCITRYARCLDSQNSYRESHHFIREVMMNTEAHDESLLAAHLQLVEAMRHSDLPNLVSLYADDTVFMPPNDTSIYGKAEIADWYTEYISHFKITGLGEADRIATIVGDWAIERWNYQVAIQPTAGGDRIVDEGRL